MIQGLDLTHPCTAFIVQDDISGVIPNLRIERRGIPGGKSTVDVHNLSQYNSIWHMVDGIQNEDMLNVSGRKNYTLHQATLILEATTLVDNGLGYKIIFMVNEKLYDKPTGLDNDARASKGTFLDSQQSTMEPRNRMKFGEMLII
uniref:Uncharacterized protein n=1 Tax=Romanomermis culicivorax TaxID=13658 RepID=A0A915JJK8_ROMCU